MTCSLLLCALISALVLPVFHPAWSPAACRDCTAQRIDAKRAPVSEVKGEVMEEGGAWKLATLRWRMSLEEMGKDGLTICRSGPYF